jgi:glycosyltransferase involved in cell wall biosynthesis
MRILVVGPSIERTKGGMATVINDQLNNQIINTHHQLSYLISHVEGSIIEKAIYSLKSLFYILFHHRKYDIIHLHTAADASFYRKSILLRISNLLNVKTILHMHGSDFDSFYLNSKPVLKKYIKNSLNKCTKIIVLSNYWKSFFDKEFPDLNVSILKNGIDVKSFESCIRKPIEFTKFLFLGRLGVRKGVYDLLKAIDIIVNDYGRKDLKFYLAGDGEESKVEKIIDNTHLQDNVKILGWLNTEEKKKVLREVEVGILPSYEENLPMALIEAMACGKVIISTYAGGIPDLVKNDVNGFLFNAGDVDQLVKLILYVSEKPDDMIKITENNINTIKENFNLDTLSIELNAIYNSI